MTQTWTAKGRKFNGHILDLEVFLDGKSFYKPTGKAFPIFREFMDETYLIKTEDFGGIQTLMPARILVKPNYV